MKKIIISLIAVILAFSAIASGYVALATNQQTYQICAENENLKEVIIPPDGEGIVYCHYEGHAGEPMEVSVLVTLTIDENGNIVG